MIAGVPLVPLEGTDADLLARKAAPRPTGIIELDGDWGPIALRAGRKIRTWILVRAGVRRRR